MKVEMHYSLTFGIAALIWVITAIPRITSQGVPAISADSFVESIGVNAHWSDPDVYTHNYTGLKAKLGESGIRYVRDGTHQANYTTANDLYHSFGIRTNVVTGRRPTSPYPAPLDPSKIDLELNEIKTNALIAVASLEAPNEYDLEHGSDTDWVRTIQNFSSLLYIKVKADESLRHLPVIGPSLTSEPAYEAVGNLDQYIDYANLHLYQWRRWPGNNGSGDSGYGSITWFLDHQARHQSPSGKPVQATEAGYNNLILKGGISEEAEGKYTIRMFAEFFRRGIVRTFKYELVNEDNKRGTEGIYGLLRGDLSEKPAFRAVKNLITILTDKGPDFVPGTLDYLLNGSINNTRQILLQKRNYDFYLIVWLEVPSWDMTTSIDLYPPPQEVVFTLANIYNISSATLYAFNNSADVDTSVLSITNSQVKLNVTDKISILKLGNKSKSISDDLFPNV